MSNIEIVLIISALGGFILFVGGFILFVYLLSDKHLDLEAKRIIKEAFGEKLSIDELKGE